MTDSDSPGLPVDDLNPSDKKILSLMIEGRDADRPWGWISPKRAADRLDTSRQYTQNRLQILQAGGYVTKTSYGIYELTERGTEVAEDLALTE